MVVCRILLRVGQCLLWLAALQGFCPVARAADCGQPADAAACLDCALTNDPRIAAADADLREAEALGQSAGLWDNPGLDVEALRAPAGGAGGNLTAGIMQPLPLSGSRRWAGRAAGRRAEASRARLRGIRWTVAAETVSALVRLRQIGDESRLVAQGEALCGVALDRFGKLAFLTDEQEAARRAFEWSRDSLRSKSRSLENETADLREGLVASLGGTAPAGWDFLVPAREDWPAWPAAEGTAPAAAAARAEAEAAGGDLRRARAERWPDPAVGPLVELGTGSGPSVGGALGITIPLVNRGKGEVARADAARARAELEASFREGSAARRRGLLERRYRDSVARLREAAPVLRDGTAELDRVRERYLAGRIPVSLVLEVLASYQGAVEAAHAVERDAVAALWEGYAVQGLSAIPRP
jgi:outer membrane protein TolC